MCGISGIFSKQEMDGNSITRSLKSIHHRGPDDSISGTYKEGKFNYYSNELSRQETRLKYPSAENILSENWIGFNRLSIIDLSSNAMQPFYDENSETAFMLNGEIYNFKELKKKELKSETFQSNSDTEVAFRLYLKYGDSFVNLLRGMFTIVIVEYGKKKLKIWRDRFGIKPLFYHISPENFIFSSEMRGIFETGKLEKKISRKHLAHLFYLQSNFAPHTMYENIYSLEAGTRLELNLEKFELKKEKYWNLNYQPQDREIGKEEFHADLEEIVKLASVSDVKQAIMLSGGLDSGMLAYFLKKTTPEIQAVTIYNKNFSRVDEYHLAKRTAEHNQIDFLPIEIPQDLSKEEIYEFATTEEEPSNTREPTYFLTREAIREFDIKVLHNALGPDELFYGYKYYTQALQLQKVNALLLNSFKYLLKGKKKYKYDELTQMGLATLPLISKSSFGWQEIQEIFGENWEHPILEIMREVPADFQFMPLIKQISWMDFHFYISSYHAFRSDQSSMRNSVEMRFPFLDHLFVQKYFNQSYLHKDLTYENNKPFVRKHAKGILDERVLSGPKKGFSIPRELWTNQIDFHSEISGLKDFFDKKDLVKWADTPAKKWLLFSTAQHLKGK